MEQIINRVSHKLIPAFWGILFSEPEEYKMSIKIWMNIDPNKIDITYLQKRFTAPGYDFDPEPVSITDTPGVLAKAEQADAVIASMEKWDDDKLSAVEGKVRFIQKYGTGLDTIDLKAAGAHGIAVANVPGANAAAVAEVALLHILNVGRKFAPCVSGVKKGIWPSTITGTELDGKIVGLLGYGRVARNLARMLKGFRVKILAFDPYVTSSDDSDVTFVPTREDLFRESDIVSLHIPSTPETKGSIDHSLFNLMKKGAYLINTCRGDVVNEKDLVDALKSGQIAAAGLDVLTHEPPEKGNELMQMDNVFISSHMGAESFESGLRSQKIMADNIEQFFHGTMPDSVRNKEYLK